MKTSVFAMALMISGGVCAENYPAANFQPQIVFQDQTLIDQSGSVGEQDGQYPAAHYQPKVLFKDQQAIAASQFDPDYPAAYFQPKIIYP